MDLRSPRPATTVRRNPPRRAKQTPAAPSSAAAPASAPPKPPSSNNPDPAKTSSFSAAAAAVASITPFPLHEILSPGPPTPAASPPPTAAAAPSPLDAADAPPVPIISLISPPVASAAKASPRLDNLKVFLRVRPLEVRPRAGKQQLGVRARGSKGLPPKGKGNNACLVVNDSGSVTLLGPSTLLDAKRTKSEVYDGFSHVFLPDSSQKEVYERVMDPLVVDFMGGKGALLAAMGPSGSGKTHTMFGCPREPGMVPLALQKIFSHSTDGGVPQPLRSYYLSMIEIYSERGKGERIFDLLPDGADLCLQQAIGKGHQEVIISNVAEAESLIARGMLKRSTAATNTNSQSSRSQCIISIRSSLGSITNGSDFPGNSAVLTIADLAGAEREKKTGNQGARLLESNFINNTSMVFGLCLRSLLEHQRNPKKPFEKHFKNSLLTRYLKEYMEGKKQMTLMLTVKPGEDDYLDTSFVLRQASPYMKIKYNNLEEIPSVPSQKRSNAIFIRSELPKRRKYNSSEPKTVDGGRNHKAVVIEHQISEKDVNSGKQRESDTPDSTNAYSKSDRTVQMGTQLSEERYDDLQRMIRNYMIMQSFAKAFWNVLKQYKQKHEVSEKEVQSLKETVADKCAQIRHLEEKLKEQNSFCLCQKQSKKDSSILQVDTRAYEPLILSANPIDSKNVDLGVADNLTPLISNQKCNGFRQNNFCQETLEELDNPEDNAQLDPSTSSLQTCVLPGDAEHSPDCHETLYEEKDTCVSVAEVVDTMDSSIPTRDVEIHNHQLQLPEISQAMIHENRHLEELNYVQTMLSKEESLAARGFMEDDKGILSEQNNEAAVVADVITKPELRASLDQDTRLNGKSQAGEIPKKEERDAPFKPSNGKIPRRRLMPASSMLLKGFSSLDIENDNPMENRSKRPAEGRERSEGSISLVHMIKSNLQY